MEEQKVFTISPPNVVCSASPVPLLLLLRLLLRNSVFPLDEPQILTAMSCSPHRALLRMKLRELKP